MEELPRRTPVAVRPASLESVTVEAAMTGEVADPVRSPASLILPEIVEVASGVL